MGGNEFAERQTRVRHLGAVRQGEGHEFVAEPDRNYFEGRKDDLRRRSAIIQSDAGLLERNLQKRAAVRDTFARALTRRGHDTATLHAEVGVLALFTAIEHWLGEDDDRTLFDCVLESLSGVVADYSPEPGS